MSHLLSFSRPNSIHSEATEVSAIATDAALIRCPSSRESNYAAAGAYSLRRANYTTHYSSCRRLGGYHQNHYCFFDLMPWTFLSPGTPSAAGSVGSSSPRGHSPLRRLTAIGSIANTVCLTY